MTGIHPKRGPLWAITAGWFDRLYCHPDTFEGTPNMLYRNNGDGTFADVSKASGIGQYVGKGMGIAFADYDDDGWTDAFVSNDTFRNFLFHNNGNGTFSENAILAGVAYTESGSTVAGMGAEFKDFDHDGRPDIFQTAMFGNTFQALGVNPAADCLLAVALRLRLETAGSQTQARTPAPTLSCRWHTEGRRPGTSTTTESSTWSSPR